MRTARCSVATARLGSTPARLAPASPILGEPSLSEPLVSRSSRGSCRFRDWNGNIPNLDNTDESRLTSSDGKIHVSSPFPSIELSERSAAVPPPPAPASRPVTVNTQNTTLVTTEQDRQYVRADGETRIGSVGRGTRPC